jgi:hypothetical protein
MLECKKVKGPKKVWVENILIYEPQLLLWAAVTLRQTMLRNNITDQ